MDLKVKLKALCEFIPFASSFTFLTCLRTILPSIYNIIEEKYSTKLLKQEGSFQTIVPKNFVHYTTSNFEFLKSTWNSMLLTSSTKAQVGSKLNGIDLPLVKIDNLNQIQLLDVMNKKNKYYILNFGSSS